MTTYTDNTTTTSNPVYDPLNEAADKAETASKDALAAKLGYGSWTAMVDAVGTSGSIIKGDLINAKLIDTKALAADTAFIGDLTSASAFIQKVRGIEFNFQKGKIGAFTIDADSIYCGTKAAQNAFATSGLTLSSKGYLSAKELVLKTDGSAIFKGELQAQRGTIGGWKLTSGGLESGEFEYPEQGDNGLSGGSGSKLFSNGGLMIIPSSSGILPSSSGILQAAYISAISGGPYVAGLEVNARSTPGGYLDKVYGIIVSASCDYWNTAGDYGPKQAPLSIYSKKGDVKVENGSIVLATDWKNISMANYCYLRGGCGYVPSSVLFTNNSGIVLSAFQTIVVCNNSSFINVTLPESGYIQPGHKVWIYPLGSERVGIVGNANDRILQGGTHRAWALINAKSGGITVRAECTFIGKYRGINSWIVRTEDTGGLSFG